MGGAPPLPLDFAPQGGFWGGFGGPFWGARRDPQKRPPNNPPKTSRGSKSKGGVGGRSPLPKEEKGERALKEAVCGGDPRAPTGVMGSHDNRRLHATSPSTPSG